MRNPFRRNDERPPAVEWVPVAWVRNQPEADMLIDILRQEGIPAFERRHASCDVPDMLAGGPREVMVPAARALEAHAVLDPMVPEPGGAT